MKEQSLPKEYKGYLTKELLEMLNKRMSHQSLEEYPREKIIAMGSLANTYRLTPESRAK